MKASKSLACASCNGSSFLAAQDDNFIGLIPMGVQQNGIKFQTPFDLTPWSRAPTDWWLWIPIIPRVYKRRKEIEGGTDYEVHRDLTLSHTSLSNDRSLSRSSGGKPLHRNATVSGRRFSPDPMMFTYPSQRLTDLLSLHQCEALRRLQRCWARRASPLLRYTNPKPLNTMSITH
jgi:hypothetical protein